MPKDTHPPSFPFYVDDFISDSAVDAMTNQELGIYVRLLCKAWKEDPAGTIPDDDSILARWAKEAPRTWQRCKVAVLRAFSPSDDGRLHQKRMKLEWQKRMEYHQSQSERGAKGASSRWHKHGTGNGTATDLPMPKNGLSSSSSVSFSTDEDVDGAMYFDSEDLSEIRAKANRFAAVVDCRKPDNRSLVAKIAVLWHGQVLSDDDVEQVLESFDRKKGIANGGAWLHTCFVNRCAKRDESFEQLLASTTVPAELEQPK